MRRVASVVLTLAVTLLVPVPVMASGPGYAASVAQEIATVALAVVSALGALAFTVSLFRLLMDVGLSKSGAIAAAVEKILAIVVLIIIAARAGAIARWVIGILQGGGP